MTWKTRPLAAWQQADVPDVVSKSLIKPAIGDGMEALKIGIDAPEPVSGLLLNPPDARVPIIRRDEQGLAPMIQPARLAARQPH
jgi:hypothetical protein